MRRFGVVPALRTLGGLALVELAGAGCVVGAERSPTRLELARVPTEPGSRDAAGLSARRGCDPIPAAAPAAASTSATGAPSASALGPAPKPANSVWIDGYCHADSLRYEWVPGHREARPPRSWK